VQLRPLFPNIYCPSPNANQGVSFLGSWVTLTDECRKAFEENREKLKNEVFEYFFCPTVRRKLQIQKHGQFQNPLAISERFAYNFLHFDRVEQALLRPFFMMQKLNCNSISRRKFLKILKSLFFEIWKLKYTMMMSVSEI
jgi:hypothetical protein